MTEFLRVKERLESNSSSSLTEKKQTVLVLYTGGTIGSTFTEKGIICDTVKIIIIHSGFMFVSGYAPAQGILEKELPIHPMLYDQQYPVTKEDTIADMKPYPLPYVIPHKLGH